MRFLLVALFSLTIGPAFAEEDNDPLSCVDPTIAAAFLSGLGYQGVPKISKDIPSGFDGIQNLEGLSHVGTSQSNIAGGRKINLGLSSILPVKDMQRQVRRFLDQQGWHIQQQPGLSGGGFKAPSQVSALQFCSDSHGLLQLIVRDLDTRTIANIISFDTGRSDCGAQGLQARRITRALHDVLPELKLPPGASVTPTYNIGMSSNSNVASTKASFSVDMTSAQVLAARVEFLLS